MRIVVVAGEPVFRLGLRSFIEQAGDMQLAGEAVDARSGFAAVEKAQPDVAVVDVCLPGLDGIDATRELRRRARRTGVLLLAPWPREREVLEGFAAGASGYALKTDSLESLREAIRVVGAGEQYLTAGLGVRKLEDLRARALGGSADVLRGLSCREREVAGLVLKGRRSREIAAELCISVKTVETHRNRINRKLGCSSAADVTRFAASNGLLRSQPEDRHERTMLLVVHEHPALSPGLARAAEERGYQCASSPNARLAMDELRAVRVPAFRMVEASAAHRVRAIVALPTSDSGQWVLDTLDHADAGSKGALLSLVSM